MTAPKPPTPSLAPATAVPAWVWWIVGTVILIVAGQCYATNKAAQAVQLARAAAADSVSKLDAAREAAVEDSARARATAAERQRDSAAAETGRVDAQRRKAESQASAAAQVALRLRDSLAGHPAMLAELDTLRASAALQAAQIQADSVVIHRWVLVGDSLTASQGVLLRALGAADSTIRAQRTAIAAYQAVKAPGPYWTPLRIAGGVAALVIAGAAGHTL